MKKVRSSKNKREYESGNGEKCGWRVTASPVVKIKRREFCFIFIQENTGVIVVKTHLYLLVATYSEGMYPSVCVEAAEKLGKFVPNACLSLLW